MSTKVIKNTNDIILATDFKKVGRNTTVQQSLIKLLGMSSSQVLEVTAKNVKQMFSDGYITPLEKQQLEITLDNLTRDKGIICNDADNLNISHTTLDTAFNAINTYLSRILADMESTYEVQTTDPDLETLISDYDDKMEDLNELIATQTSLNGFYGSLKIVVSIDKESLETTNDTANISASLYYKNVDKTTSSFPRFDWTLTGVNFSDSRYSSYYNPTTGMYEGLNNFYITYSEIANSQVSIKAQATFNTDLLA